jgi:hypothetical protein
MQKTRSCPEYLKNCQCCIEHSTAYRRCFDLVRQNCPPYGRSFALRATKCLLLAHRGCDAAEVGAKMGVLAQVEAEAGVAGRANCGGQLQGACRTRNPG